VVGEVVGMKMMKDGASEVVGEIIRWGVDANGGNAGNFGSHRF
jgi:hypothetical protein